MRKFTLLLTAGCLFILAGCGGGGGGSSKTAQIRFGNFTSNATSGMQVLIDGTDEGTVSYGQGTAYLSVASGTHTLEIRNPTTSTDFINQGITLSGDTSYTFVALGAMADGRGMLFTDDNTAPTTGNVKFRTLDLSTALGPIDVYFDPTANLFNITPAATVSFPGASSYLSMAAGQYRLRVTQSPNKNPKYDGGNLSYTAGAIRTFVVFDGPSGLRAVTLSDAN